MFELKDAEIITESSEPFCVSVCPNEKNTNVNGSVHGGVLFLLCDEAVGRYCTSLGLKGAASDGNIHFYRPAKVNEKLTATVSVRKKGRKLGVYLVEITNPDGKLVADTMFTVVFAD